MLRVGTFGTGGTSSIGDVRRAVLDGDLRLLELACFRSVGVGLLGGLMRDVVDVVAVRDEGLSEDFAGEDGVDRVEGLGIRDIRV